MIVSRKKRVIILFFLVMLATANKTQAQTEDTKPEASAQKNETNTNILAGFLKRAGKYQDAARLYHNIGEKTEWNKGRAHYLNQEAQIYWESGEYAKAREIFTHIWETGGKELKAEKAKSEKLTTRTAIIPWNQIEQAGFSLANIKRIQGELPGAVSIYQAIEKESSNPENKRRATFNLAQLEISQGHLDEAQRILITLSADLKKAEDLNQHDERRFARPEPYENIGIPALENLPPIDNERVLLALTEICESKKDYPKLIETYTDLAENSKQFIKKQTYLYLLASANINAGKKDAAIAAYRQIVEQEETRLKKQEEFFSKRKDQETKMPPLKMGPLGLMAEEEIRKLQGKQDQ